MEVNNQELSTQEMSELEAAPQTGAVEALENEDPGCSSAKNWPDDGDSQTDPDVEQEAVCSEELPVTGGMEEQAEGAAPQTEMGEQPGTAIEPALQDSEVAFPQTDFEEANQGPRNAIECADTPAKSVSPQTGTEMPKTPRRRRKTSEAQTQSDGAANSGENTTANDAGSAPDPKRKRATVRPIPVLSIDERRTVETEADRAKNDLLDLLESQKSGRILTGTIQGVERALSHPAHSFAVIYHGDFKVIIPAEEAVEPPEDYRGRLPEDVLHYMLTKRLGAEVDYIVKGIDPESNVAVASRLDAMRAKRKQYYMGTDRDGNHLLYSGVCAEARIVSVIRAGIFVDLFGLEIYIPLRELSYQRWMDAAGHFQPGQRILVKVLAVDRSNRNQIRASASVKQAGENPYEKALRRYSIDSCYVGTVSMVDTNGVFVALDGGIDCLCSYPKRGRPPRGARVTVRILGINYEANRIWGAITHIAVPR